MADLMQTFKDLKATQTTLKLRVVKGKNALPGDIIWTEDKGYTIFMGGTQPPECKVYKVISIKV